MTKHYLIVCDRPPYGSVGVQESLDMATAAAAFDLTVKVLLRGDAVYAAVAAQATDALGQRNLGKYLRALGIYGVAGIFVSTADLAERGLSESELVADVDPLAPSEIDVLMTAGYLVVQL